jgi:hypothetical protein
MKPKNIMSIKHTTIGNTDGKSRTFWEVFSRV